MSSTAITFKLPITLREKIQTWADIERRSEANWIRFHLEQIVEDLESQEHPNADASESNEEGDDK